MTARWLALVVRASTARPWVTGAASLILAAAALLYAGRALAFQTSNLRLLPATAPYAVRFAEYLQDFGELNDIVVAVHAPAPEAVRRYVDRLVAELGRHGLEESRLAYRVDPAALAGRALLYLPLERLAELREQVIDDEEFLEAYAARPTLGRLLEGVNERFGRAIASHFMDLGLEPTGTGDTRFLEVILEQITARLSGAGAPYRSPWESLAGGPVGSGVRYFVSRDSRYGLVFVEARRQRGAFAENRSTVEAIRAAIHSLGPAFPDVEAGVTGTPAISSDEMVTAFADSKTAGVVAMVGTVALLLAAFRRVAAPMLMLLSLAVSQAWALGIITATVGHLSIFSVMFISIVVGIGIDYGIYILCRADEETAGGATPREALDRVARRAGPGVLLGATTAASAFFVLALTDFRGIQEFGVISGIAILTAFLAMITLFPASLVLLARWRPAAEAGPGPPRAAENRRLPPLARGRRWIVVVAIAITALGLAAARRVGFDDNILRLQADGVESVRWEQRLLAGAGGSGVSALATAGTLEEVQRKADAFAALPSVSRVDSILTVLPDRQAEKVPLIRALASSLAALRVARPPALVPSELQAPAESLARRLALAVAEAPTPRPELQRLQALTSRLLVDLRQPLGPGAWNALEALQGELAADFEKQLERLRANVNAAALRPDDVPPALRRRYVGASGRFLLRAQPAIDVWEHAGAARFVGELRTVDPEVTGASVITYESIQLMKRGYLQGTAYALIVVSTLTALMFRDARDTLAALVPLALGMIWTLGLMPLAGLSFDLANVWAVPLLIGTGAEYGANLLTRFREARTGTVPPLGRSIVLAILLNGLTTIAGFGSLMVAHHHGIFGLGLLLTIGAATTLVAALVVLPAAMPTRRLVG
jgi:hopanoid biosynthesis associated RND transporter like protein HpnN